MRVSWSRWALNQPEGRLEHQHCPYSFKAFLVRCFICWLVHVYWTGPLSNWSIYSVLLLLELNTAKLLMACVRIYSKVTLPTRKRQCCHLHGRPFCPLQGSYLVVGYFLEGLLLKFWSFLFNGMTIQVKFGTSRPNTSRKSKKQLKFRWVGQVFEFFQCFNCSCRHVKPAWTVKRQRKSRQFMKNSRFCEFSVMHASASNFHTSLTWSMCLSGVRKNVKISSKCPSARKVRNFISRTKSLFVLLRI